MAGGSVGTIFAELDLDTSRYSKAQQRLLQDATTTSLSIEKNFKNLGIKTAAEYDLMRAKITNSYEAITRSAKATADDLIRAEKAKADQLTRINEQQFGKQTSLITTLKGHWLAATAIIGASAYTVSQAWSLVKQGAEFEEQQGILDNLGRKYNVTADSIVADMERASTGLVAKADLMGIALSGLGKGLNPDQLIGLADAAEILGDVVGVNTTTALKDLTEALETGRTKALKGYTGSTIDLKDAFDGLDTKMTAAEKTQAMYDLVMIQATELQSRQTKKVGETADQIERLEANYKNATTAAANFMKAVVGGGYGLLFGSPEEKAQFALDMVIGGTKNPYLSDSLSGLPTTPGNHDRTMIMSAGDKKIVAAQKEIADLRAALQGRKDAGGAIKPFYLEKDNTPGYVLDQKDIAHHALNSIDDQEVNAAISKQKDLNKEILEDYLRSDGEKMAAADKINEEWAAKEKKRIADAKDYESDYWKKTEEEKQKDTLYAIGWLEKQDEETRARAEKRAEYERDILKDIRGSELSYYDASVALIKSQAAEFKKAGVDEVAITVWAKNEELKAWDKYVDTSGTVWDRLEKRHRDYIRENDSANKIMFDVIEAGYENLESQISTNFFDVLTGRFDEMKWSWTDLWDSMAQIAASTMSRMAVDAGSKLIETGVNWAIDTYGSDVLDWAMGMAEGAFEVKQDRVTKVHKGEMIVPASTAKWFRDNSTMPGETWADQTAGIPQASPMMAEFWRGAGNSLLRGIIGREIGGLLAGSVLAPVVTPLAGITALVRGGMRAWDYSKYQDVLEKGIASGAYKGYSVDPSTGYGAVRAYYDGSNGSEVGGDVSHAGSGPGGSGGGYSGREWGGLRYGGIARGPESGYKATLHGTELVVSPKADFPAKVVGQAGGNTYILQANVITTDDVDAWFAGRMRRTQDFKRGAQYQEVNTASRGIKT